MDQNLAYENEGKETNDIVFTKSSIRLNNKNITTTECVKCRPTLRSETNREEVHLEKISTIWIKISEALKKPLN